MAVLLTIAAVGHPMVRERRWLMGALVSSALGDTVLALPWWDSSFEVGLGAFLIAHLCFLGILVPLIPGARPARSRIVAVLGMVLVAAVLLAWFWPHLGLMAPMVLVYIVVLTAMVSAAFLAHLPTRWTAVGAAFFAASDALIAVGQFILVNDSLAVLIWWFYAAAMMLITGGLFFGRDAETAVSAPGGEYLDFHEDHYADGDNYADSDEEPTDVWAVAFEDVHYGDVDDQPTDSHSVLAEEPVTEILPLPDSDLDMPSYSDPDMSSYSDPDMPSDSDGALPELNTDDHLVNPEPGSR